MQHSDDEIDSCVYAFKLLQQPVQLSGREKIPFYKAAFQKIQISDSNILVALV